MEGLGSTALLFASVFHLLLSPSEREGIAKGNLPQFFEETAIKARQHPSISPALTLLRLAALWSSVQAKSKLHSLTCCPYPV